MQRIKDTFEKVDLWTEKHKEKNKGSKIDNDMEEIINDIGNLYQDVFDLEEKTQKIIQPDLERFYENLKQKESKEKFSNIIDRFDDKITKLEQKPKQKVDTKDQIEYEE